MKPTMVMLCGLPASGKSTYAKKLSQEIDAVVLSSDALRWEMFGDETDQSHNPQVFQELHKRAKDLLRSGRNVVYDATNISSKRRRTFLNELKKIDCTKECIIMATPYEQCLDNNKNRARQVPERVIERMYRKWQTPHWFEGWDDIEIIYEGSNIKPKFNRGSFENMAKHYMKGFNQNNPHHIYDVYDHSKALAIQYPINDIRRVAAMLHDCMKKKCEFIDDTGVSHFYNHANISSYYVLSHPRVVNCETFKDMIDIIFYITYHMSALNLQSDKTKKKYERIFGKQLFDSLMDFSDKDKIASNVAIFNKKKQNIYIPVSDYCIGYTRLGDMFYVDLDDVSELQKYTWCIKNKNNNDYRLVSMTDGSMKFMHRVIIGVQDTDIVIDHINHIQYDNRKINLRACTNKENCRNTSLSKNNSSGVNGVSKMPNGKYRAYINVDGKQKYLGVFDTIFEAKEARHRANEKYYKEFANFEI